MKKLLCVLSLLLCLSLPALAEDTPPPPAPTAAAEAGTPPHAPPARGRALSNNFFAAPMRSRFLLDKTASPW